MLASISCTTSYPASSRPKVLKQLTASTTNDSLYKDGRIEAGSKNSLGGRARRCDVTQTIDCNSNVREDKIVGKKILIYLKTLHMKKNEIVNHIMDTNSNNLKY